MTASKGGVSNCGVGGVATNKLDDCSLLVLACSTLVGTPRLATGRFCDGGAQPRVVWTILGNTSSAALTNA